MVSKTSSLLLIGLAVLCASSAVSARELLSNEDHGYCYVCSHANHQSPRCSGYPNPNGPGDDDLWCRGAAQACIDIGLGCIVSLKAILNINALVCAKVLILIKANLGVFLSICGELGAELLATCCQAYPTLLAHLIAVVDVNLLAVLFLRICANLGLVGVNLIVGVWDRNRDLCDPTKVTLVLRIFGHDNWCGQLLQTCKAHFPGYWGILKPRCGDLINIWVNLLGIVSVGVGLLG